MCWNFVRFHEIYFQTDSESFSFLSWKTKKFYSKKKYIYISALFSKHTKIIPKDGASRLNFPEGFDYNEEALHLASKETVWNCWTQVR